MLFYTIGNSVPSSNEYARIIGMLVGKPESKFVMGQNRWTINIMQQDNQMLKIRYTSESAEQDLNFRRLDNYSGTIVYLTMLDLSGLKKFGEVELHYCPDEMNIMTLEYETPTSISSFQKDRYLLIELCLIC